jgi:hypothetical protein
MPGRFLCDTRAYAVTAAPVSPSHPEQRALARTVRPAPEAVPPAAAAEGAAWCAMRTWCERTHTPRGGRPGISLASDDQPIKP